uniref:Putative endopeptidase n=1 Tax=Mycobacterium riyadhense TaxID=486698 RepID=A0A653EWR9_9MYCO|nr:putative endopeptidase precursor [Mycobacterium riyadhense]
MSLDALVAEASHALGEARGLFGPAPADAAWGSTPTLSGGRTAVVQAVQAAGRQWQGSGGGGYISAGSGHVSGLDSVIGADNGTAPGLSGAVRAASFGRDEMDGVITQTRAGVSAIAPSTGTPAGRAELVTHLQGQLNRARALLLATEQRNAALAAMIRTAATGYGASPMGMSPMMGGPSTMSGGGGSGAGLVPGGGGFAGLFGSHVRHSRSSADPTTLHRYALGGGGPAARMAVKAAVSRLGRPYVWGAKGPDSFDCSGLVHWSYAQAGVTLGADTYTMYGQGTQVAPGDVQAGDVIFPSSSFDKKGPGHVMLAVSPTECIEAQQSGVPVKFSPMPTSFVARRVAP